VGISDLDNNGEATMQLPEYFGELNKNPKYQLTPINQSMPNLYIKEEVNNNQFVIAGGEPFGKVSWEIKGERNDKIIMRDHPFVAKEEKRIPGLLYEQ